MKSIINKNVIDYTKEPLFFGQTLSIQTYIKPKYQKFLDLFKEQLSFFWRPEEINVTKDKADYENLSDNEKFIFTKNLGYQILLDSIQSRGISHLLEDCSSPEIEAFAKIWEFSETVHSYSYTYIIKNVFPNPEEMMNSILQDEEILKRTTSVTKYYDDLINNISDETLYNKKKKLYLTLISINILEGIRFYVSFACSFSFAQNKKMIGNSDIISLLLRDENLHLGFSSLLIKILSTEESEGFLEVVNDCKDIVIQMYKDAAQEEIEWAEYLFKNGSIVGLNAEIIIQYMKYLTNNRMKMIHLEPIFPITKNPINWMNNWTSSKGVQEAPQEKEKTSYVVGAFKQDIDDNSFNDFTL